MSSRVGSGRRLSSSRFLARVLPGAQPAPRTQLPSGSGYVHEAKLDGYRMQAHLRDGRVTLYSRNAVYSEHF